MTARWIVALCALLLAASCAAPAQPGDAMTGAGTIRYAGIEGGFYYIAADDGKRYDPMNLPAEYRQEGLRVRFRARIRTDVASVHMFGTIVEILEISRL